MKSTPIYFDTTLRAGRQFVSLSERIGDPDRSRIKAWLAAEIKQPDEDKVYLMVWDSRDNTQYEGIHLLSIITEAGQVRYDFERRDLGRKTFLSIPLDAIRVLQTLY